MLISCFHSFACSIHSFRPRTYPPLLPMRPRYGLVDADSRSRLILKLFVQQKPLGMRGHHFIATAVKPKRMESKMSSSCGIT